MLQKILLQEARDLQSADEREYGDVLIAIGDLGQLALEVADVRFEVIALPHLDGEKMVVVPFSLSARCVLSGECFRHVLKVVERMQM